ncbi:MAG: glycosyltransferase family 4 protein [Pseudomonadota bacterium]
MVRVVLINDASVARGGATGLATLQARLLRERGHEVVYAAGDGGGNTELPALGVETRHAGGGPLIKLNPAVAATRGFLSAPARRMVADLVASDTPETVYHVHSFAKALTPSIFTALQPVARRTFVHAHDFFLACPNGGFVDYRQMKPCERAPLSLDCLSTNCDKRNYAQKLWRSARQAALHRTMPRRAPWAKILLIHPGMRPYLEKAGYPPEALQALRNPATAYRAERIEAERNERLFFIGRLEAEKGIEELIDAAAQAGAPLTVIGTGPMEDQLRAAHPDVTFCGWMDRNAIADVVGQARALVMPTRYPEPFGLVAAEASLSGLPVILSRSALLGPEMEARGVGVTCDPRNGAEFVAILRRVMAMPADAIGAMSRKAASGEAALCTTPEQWIDAQIALFEAAVAETKRPS